MYSKLLHLALSVVTSMFYQPLLFTPVTFLVMEIRHFFLEPTTVEKRDYVQPISTKGLPLISCSIVCVAFMASGFEQKPFEKVNSCPTRCNYMQFIIFMETALHAETV
jgi:hypothetical protein